MRMQIAAFPGLAWERCSEASWKPLTSGPDPVCAGSPRGPGPGRNRLRGWGDGSGSRETAVGVGRQRWEWGDAGARWGGEGATDLRPL